MEKKKRKKKSFIVKLKKIFIEIWKSIKETFSNLIKKFKALPKTAQYITYTWSVVVLIILIIIFACVGNNSYLKDYKKFELSIRDAAKEYFEEKEIYAPVMHKEKIDYHVLESEGYLYEEDVLDKTCDGYSVGYYDENKKSYVIDSYIKCDGYITEGYYDYK